MQTVTENLVDANQFCIYHNVEISFIHSLHQSGLIEIVVIKETVFIPAEQLEHLEKLARFHYEMDINLEGIETIAYLLEKIKKLQEEITIAENKLRLYNAE
ncbi:MAG TPA: chaperone modulator CbpM [Ferruginibacter sp.]|jgi:chaperone modulatory protein CbpM|nr:chaperone modulator CbpM [Ferruginibacter sp.]